jgi:hypothetical protein
MKEPAMQDLLVVGLDLTTGREVHIDDAPVSYWRSAGHHAAGTLVCASCHAGVDVPEPISVPLVVRGRIGGARRAHFAHPPYQAPVGGHSPESVWHLTAKTTLAAWAARQPGVVRVDVECCTPDRSRRTDVRIQFEDGREVALEVQATPLTDQQWLDRHDAYRQHGIVDVWLWRPGTSPHWVVPAQGEYLWEFEPAEHRAWLLLGAEHERAGRWWAEPDRHRYVPHLPPCVNDRLLRYPISSSELAVTADGLVVPAGLLDQIADATTSLDLDAQRLRDLETTTASPALEQREGHQSDEQESRSAETRPTGRRIRGGVGSWERARHEAGAGAGGRGPP